MTSDFLPLVHRCKSCGHEFEFPAQSPTWEVIPGVFIVGTIQGYGPQFPAYVSVCPTCGVRV